MLDMNKLKAVQKDLDTKAGGGDGLFVNTKDLKEETDFRIAPPKANLNGSYFLEVIVWWINKKIKIISPATFGLPDPIQEEVDAARAENDAELNALIDDTEILNKKSEFWVPGYFLNCEFDAKGNPTKVLVVDDKGKVLSTGPQLMKAINRQVTSRNVQNGTDNGIADRELGYNLLLQKTKTGNKKTDVEYGAQAWREPYAMDEKYYADNKIPDVVKIAKDQIDSEEYQISAIRNFLYGEELMEKPKKSSTAAETKAPVAKGSNSVAANRGAAKPAAAKKEAAPVVRRGTNNAAAEQTDDNAQQEEGNDKADTTTTRRGPAAARNTAGTGRGTATANATGSKRSLVDDNFDLDD